MPPDRSIPGKEIEIHILRTEPAAQSARANGQLPGRVYVRVNGGGLCFSHPCVIPYLQIREDYEELEKKRDEDSPHHDYYEHKLATALGAALFGEPSHKGASQRELSQALSRCVDTLESGEYVRLLLYCEDSIHERLPWELTFWWQRALWLGRDPRVALTRLAKGSGARRRQRLSDDNDTISILRLLSTDDENDLSSLSKLARSTRRELEFVEDIQPRLHFVPRTTLDFNRLRSAYALSRTSSSYHVVQWLGHGGANLHGQATVTAAMKVGENDEELTAKRIHEWTGGAFLYVMLACDSFGEPTGKNATQPSLARDLIEAGAATVLGSYAAYAPRDSEPLMTPLYLAIAAGLPLDFTIQYLRRSIHTREQHCKNARRKRNPWSHLILMSGSSWYLGGHRMRSPYRLLQTLPLRSLTHALSVWNHIFEAAFGPRDQCDPLHITSKPAGPDGTGEVHAAWGDKLIPFLEALRHKRSLEDDPVLASMLPVLAGIVQRARGRQPESSITALHTMSKDFERIDAHDGQPDGQPDSPPDSRPDSRPDSLADGEIELTEKETQVLRRLRAHMETLSLVHGLM